MIESKLEKKRKNILGKRQIAIFRRLLRKLKVIGFVSTSFQVMDGFAAFNDAVYIYFPQLKLLICYQQYQSNSSREVD